MYQGVHDAADLPSGVRVRSASGQRGCFVVPLAVSGPRGVAAAFTSGLRAQTLDLEEHEEEEDDDAEGEESVQQ